MSIFISFNNYCMYYVYKITYKNQSIGITSVTSSTGKPTAVNTIAIVTKPAEGIPAAPIAAAVDVKLKEMNKTNTQYGDRSRFYSPWFLKIKTNISQQYIQYRQMFIHYIFCD